MIARLLVATLLSSLTIPKALAAFLFVLNTNDSGAGSLRQTIQNAAAGDTIRFSISKTDPGYSIATGQYTISLTTDQLLINKDLTIETGGNASVIVQRSGAGGTPAFRIFDIPSGTVTLGELMIAGGASASGDGGAIRNSGTLTVRGCTFFSKTANGSGFAVFGGAINNGGTLTALNSTLSGNAAIYGEAIYNSGSLTVTHCTIDGNVTNDAIQVSISAWLLISGCRVLIAAGQARGVDFQLTKLTRNLISRRSLTIRARSSTRRT